jgi:cation-transporting ATPase I
MRGIAARAATTALAAAGAWLVARATGTRGRTSTVGLVALVAAQLGQTLTSGAHSRLVLGAVLASLAALVFVVQTPGISHFFGCRPLGPVGWTAGLGAAVIATAVAGLLPRLLPGTDNSPALGAEVDRR